MKHILISLLTLATISGAASSALAERLPPDLDASPKAGEQPAPLVMYSQIPSTGVTSEPLDDQRNLVRSFGNSSWGGEYRLYEHVRAPNVSFQSINFHYHAKGRLWGQEVEGFSLGGATWNPRNDSRASRMQIRVLGRDIFNERDDSTAQFSTTEVAHNRLPFDKKLVGGSKTFTLGPIPVKVSGSIHGYMGVNVRAKAYRSSATRSGVEFSGTSFAKLYGRMSAGVDVRFASAGVRGQVTFVEIRPAKTIKVDRYGSEVKYQNKFTVKLSSLEGNLDVYASLFSKEWEKTILDWDGYSYTYPFADTSGTIRFGYTTIAQPLARVAN